MCGFTQRCGAPVLSGGEEVRVHDALPSIHQHRGNVCGRLRIQLVKLPEELNLLRGQEAPEHDHYAQVWPCP